MPPSKVCPQCNAVVPIRLKVCKFCQHVFRAKRQIEHALPARAMKRLRVALPNSMKSVIKAKDKLQKTCKRAAESREQTLHRQQQNKEHMASVRAAESREQTLHRQQQNKEHMASVRAAESREQTLHRHRKYRASVREGESRKQTLHRQQHDREYRTSLRSAESGEQTLHRQQHDREYRAAKRANDVSIEQAIVPFHSDIKSGPDFVCTCFATV